MMSIRHQLAGVRIIESVHMVDTRVDATACRSPARALRRWRKRGILGRIRITNTPKPDAYQMQDGSLVVHPATARAIRERLAAEIDRRLLDQLGGLGL